MQLNTLAVCFVLHFSVTKAGDKTIQININRGGCTVQHAHYELIEGFKFSLNIVSNCLIKTSRFQYKLKVVELDNLPTTEIIVTYKSHRSLAALNYSLVYTANVIESSDGILGNNFMSGDWYFFFYAAKECNTIADLDSNGFDLISCSTKVAIVPAKYANPKITGRSNDNVDDKASEGENKGGSYYSAVTIGLIFGFIVLIQTMYIIYAKCSCQVRAVDISKRPPLPLPQDIYDGEPTAPRSPILARHDQSISVPKPPDFPVEIEPNNRHNVPKLPHCPVKAELNNRLNGPTAPPCPVKIDFNNRNANVPEPKTEYANVSELESRLNNNNINNLKSQCPDKIKKQLGELMSVRPSLLPQAPIPSLGSTKCLPAAMTRTNIAQVLPIRGSQDSEAEWQYEALPPSNKFL